MAEETFKDRLVHERRDLSDKIEKLSTFLKSHGAHKLDDIQSNLLHIQLASMRTYLGCLDARLKFLD